MQEWTTEASQGGAPRPRWEGAAAGRSFDIRWVEQVPRPIKGKQAAYNLDDLVADIKARAERIAALEKILEM